MLIAANWKMNGSLEFTKEFLNSLVKTLEFSDRQVLVCPPSLYLLEAKNILSGNKVMLGAQNVSHQLQGPYTGEHSAAMLKEFCSHVIVGHSERRTLFKETDDLVAEKALAVVNSGMCPIICVGESLADKNSGNTFAVVEAQIAACLNKLDSRSNFVIAYEPVWAIGTGLSASPEEAQKVHKFLRDIISKHNQSLAKSVQIIYGGSVKSENAASFIKMPDIDGVLVGGASLKLQEFLSIIEAK